MAICTFNARTLASEACIEDLMMQARKIKYDVIGEPNNPSRTFVIKKMWLNPSCDHLRCLRANIELRRRGVGSVSNGSGEALQGRPSSLRTRRDFKTKVGPRSTAEELHIGTHGMEWNELGEKLSEFIMSTHTIHGNSQFQKPSHLRWTWESPGEQFHDEIDHIIFYRRLCLTDVAVVPKFYTKSDHRLLRARFCSSVRGEKRSPKTSISWDHFAPLVSECKDSVIDNIDEEYSRLVDHLHDKKLRKQRVYK
nr:reverse transcriptase [Haemonchus contortus]